MPNQPNAHPAASGAQHRRPAQSPVPAARGHALLSPDRDLDTLRTLLSESPDDEGDARCAHLLYGAGLALPRALQMLQVLHMLQVFPPFSSWSSYREKVRISCNMCNIPPCVTELAAGAVAWCKANGLHARTAKGLTQALKAKGFAAGVQWRDGRAVRVIHGLRL